MAGMSTGYNQFCPVAKAAEVFATRWTPLIIRELMAGIHSFNDIHRGIPLISRAVLVVRLRELEKNGIVERRAHTDGAGSEYWLTPAGEAFGPAIRELRRWGLAHGRDRVTPGDLDPALLLWGFRKRADRHALPDRRVVVRFEFSGVPASRTKYRIMWLLLDRSHVDVCVKDPGYAVDLLFRGNIADFVAVYCGHLMWLDLAGKALLIEGEDSLARQLPGWLRLDKVPGPDFPVALPAA
jgi:DNA-binding HxlR family transcriptional regulator